MPGPDPIVSVVIPCRNEAAHLPRLLEALRAQEAPLHEVIVVDNGSLDGSAEVIRDCQRAYPAWPLRLLECQKPGVAAALNMGIEAATGDVIVRLDGHCLPRADYVRRSADHLQETGVGVVGGVWEVAAGRNTLMARAIAAALTHRLATGGAEYRHPNDVAGAISVDTVPFGCYRKSLWKQVGGYDEWRTINEDYVFNYQTRLLGLRVVLDPKIRSTYFARETLGRLAQQYFRYGWGKAAMLKQYPGAIRWRQVIPGGFAVGLMILSLLSVFVPAARWLFTGVLVMYLGVLFAAAAQLASRTRAWSELPVYMAAFAIVQLGWGSGACVNAVTFGRWPAWGSASKEQS